MPITVSENTWWCLILLKCVGEPAVPSRPAPPALSLPPALTGGQPCHLFAQPPFCAPSSWKWRSVGLGGAVRTALRGAGGPGAARWDGLAWRGDHYGVAVWHRGEFKHLVHHAPCTCGAADKQAAHQGHGASSLADFHTRMAALGT